MPDNGPTIPSVADTPQRLNTYKWSDWLTAAGAAILALQSMLPDVQALFPRQKWIGFVVIFLAKWVSGMQRKADVKNTEEVRK